MADAENRGAASEVLAFEQAMLTSRAVAARPVYEIERLAQSDSSIYPTYYGVLAGDHRVPADDPWTYIIRPRADATLFPGYFEKLRCATLSMDDTGAASYGGARAGFIIFREAMIAHRTTVFEMNATLWAQNNVKSNDQNITIPRGYRATWQDRGRLAVAKLASQICAGASIDEMARLVVVQADSSTEEQFIEVHICGQMTRKTIESVTMKRSTRRGRSAEQMILEAQLRDAGIKVNWVK
jgi:hypothetical protein